MKEVIPAKREQLKKLKAEHGNKVIGEIKVENVIGGMRYVYKLSFINAGSILTSS